MVGILYFVVIIIANTTGSISGMGGGVIIKPIFDLIGAHDVESISFYSSVAIFVMASVTITLRLIDSHNLEWKIANKISGGPVIGGVLGNVLFEICLNVFKYKDTVQLVQITLIVLTLIFAFIYTKYEWKNYHLTNVIWYYICGIVLGFLASLLGIGGGPINVSLLMLLFSLPIKKATEYSICIIFFSQLAKLISVGTTEGYAYYDLTLLWFIVPAAIIGGLLGNKFSNILSAKSVTKVFQCMIFFILIINFYNAYRIL